MTQQIEPVIEQSVTIGKEQLVRRIIFQRKYPFLKQRGAIVRSIRSFFEGLGFEEVQTPAIQVSPGMETHLVAFQTELVDPTGPRKVNRYLHTSPEFAMKKLLASGMEKIFQIALVYRNQERSHTHHPEFSMLEWYRANEEYTELMKDCEGLLRACKRAASGPDPFTWNGLKSDPFLEFERLTVQEAFMRYAEIDILNTIDFPAAPTPKVLLEECKRIRISTAPDDTWEDLFFRIFLEKIEKHLGVGRPTFLYDYPISMAALSRPKKSNPKLAERFELYVCGLELANAFGELTNSEEQRARFQADMTKKKKLYGIEYPIDEDFLAAVAEMPEASGIALGVDRLVMLATGATQIEDVLWIPVAAPEI